MPILGTIASSKLVSSSDFVFIDSYTVSGSSTSVFTISVPNTYKHLQIRLATRDSRANENAPVWVQPNSDTSTSSYVIAGFYATPNSAPSVYGFYNTTDPGIQAPGGGNNLEANAFSNCIMTWFDYNDTNKYKTALVQGFANDANTGDEVAQVHWGVWKSTSAITSFRFPAFTSPYIANSFVAIYGMKG